MTPARPQRITIAVLSVAVVLGCTAQSGSDQNALSRVDATYSAPLPAGAKVVPASTAAAPQADQSCNPTASLRPIPPPAAAPPPPPPAPGQPPAPPAPPVAPATPASAGPTLATIVARGRLVVGVDQNTYLFGFRNPKTGLLEGFDVDVAREMARGILGDPDKIQFQALTSAQRVPALQSGQVDMVVRSMTITCERLKDVAFSTVYFQANQRVLARTDSGIREAADLGGKRACATTGSTSVSTLLALKPAPTVYGVADWTDCLVMLQQGDVDAVSTDDSILVGLQDQDPYLRVVGASLSPEPYGIGLNRSAGDLVRFVNGVLDRMRTDGTWQRIYTRWLSTLGPTPAPPPATYSD